MVDREDTKRGSGWIISGFHVWTEDVAELYSVSLEGIRHWVQSTAQKQTKRLHINFSQFTHYYD